MTQDVARVHVEVPVQTAIAEEGGAFVTSTTSPFWVVDAAEVAETAGRGVLRAHEVVDGCAEGFLTIGCGWRFRLKAHDLAGTVEYLRAVFRRDDLSPDIGVGVFAGTAVQVAEEAEIEVSALCTPNVAVPDGSTAEVAGCNDGIREANELNGGDG